MKDLKASVVLTIILLLVCCGLYPLTVWAAGQVLFPHQANGSLVFDAAGKPIASTLLGQTFNGDGYFNPRPSSAGQGYDASSSSGSNLGPTSQTLHDNVKQRIADYRKANNLPDTHTVPADAVTASASGLDPHISIKNALLQLPRVARVRGLRSEDLRQMMDRYTDGRAFGILGEPGVNIVKLNLALDGKYK